MDFTIGLASVIALGVDIALGLALPVGAFLLLHKKYEAHWKPFLVGCIVALLGGFMLVQMLHTIILSAPGIGMVLQGNPWLYSLCYGLLVTLIEETARLWMFRTQVRDLRENDYNAWMFGAGQGGLEALCLLSVGMLGNYLMALAIYQGQLPMMIENSTAEELENARATLTELTQKPVIDILMLGVKRISFTAVYMAMSVLVWFAAKDRQIRFPLFLAALGLRFVFQFAVTVMEEIKLPAVAVQGCACVLAAGCIAVAAAVWKREHVPTPEEV